MKISGNKLLFAVALMAGLATVLAKPAYQRLTEPAPAVVHPLSGNIYVTEQLTPGQLARLRRDGFSRIVDLRPDGEAAGQPSAAAMQTAANANDMRFDYVPVPHGAIPSGAVTALEAALAQDQGQVLLYCRSGRRAARTWGLVEASRPGGQAADAILAAVKSSGQSADDLRDEIVRRVAARPGTKGAKP